jgi:superfamily II DNA or RNA helicase
MLTMTGFDTDNPDFDPVKYIRQLRCIVRWKKCGARATIEAATGFGKTTMAFIAIKKMMTLKSLTYNKSVLVVVPTTKLKQQWRKNLDKIGLQHVEVQVINTVSLTEGFKRQVDLLIMDEVHLFAADKFRRVFERVQYSWLLGLTATLERMDGKCELLRQKAPTCDVITQKEAVLKGWIADFIEFNLAVPINRREAEAQVSMGKQIRYYMSKFDDFYHMLSCMHKGNATRYAQQCNKEPGEVLKWATQGIRLVHARKNFLDTTEHKIDAAVELIQEFGVRTITFSQATAFAEKVAERLGKDCRQYHTQIESETRMIAKKKEYVRKTSAVAFMEKQQKLGYKAWVKPRKDKFLVTWKVPKSISGSKIADENVDLFEKGKIKYLVSAKALDQGFDVPDVMLGVDGSRSENPTQHTQRTGRVARNFLLPNGKYARKVYVNLCIPDWCVANSRDEQKLRKCQSKNPDNVVWVNDLEELKEMLNAILIKRGSTGENADDNSVVESTDSYIDS